MAVILPTNDLSSEEYDELISITAEGYGWTEDSPTSREEFIGKRLLGNMLMDAKSYYTRKKIIEGNSETEFTDKFSGIMLDDAPDAPVIPEPGS